MACFTVAVECSELPPLTNGVITYSLDTEAPYALGTMAEHMCNQGYRLVGVQTRVCEDVGTAVGEFSGEPPVCEGKTLLLVKLIMYLYLHYCEFYPAHGPE